MSYMTNKGGETANMQTTLDNLILYVENVSIFQWDSFRKQLEVAETYGRIPRVSYYIGTGISKYHYNLVIGQGGGAVHIGFKHNGSKEHREAYTLRLEVNPSKELMKGSKQAQEWFREIFVQSFVSHKKTIKGVDIAYDIPVKKEELMVVSLTGRDRNVNKGTLYYGERGQHGQLKVYDKKKELKKKQGIEIEEEHLTRIEYSLRLDEPLTIQWFGALSHYSINDMYKISKIDTADADPLIRAIIFAVNNNEMQLKEFSRTFQQKTKKALDRMGLVDLDGAFSSARDEILTLIKRYLAPHNDSIIDYHLNSEILQ